MELKHLSRKMPPTKATTSLVHVIKPDLIVTSGITELDRLTGGFKAGELTLVDGNSSRIATLPDKLCVNTYRMFHSQTIYIDGGMCTNPYQIARYARIMELDQHDVLENIVISRAFTVYQLSTLIQEMLESLIQKRSPRTLLIGMLPLLYLDCEVPAHEAQTLLAQDLKKLQQLTTRYNLITVLTSLDAIPLSPHRGLGKILYAHVNETIRMKQFEQYTCLELINQEKTATIAHGAAGQLHLEAFGMVN